ncbi:MULTISPECIES: FAD-binding oxidoreductase [unclassified Legionella]|uniref:FAD-binding oxidoreductase n=1 Tax=unclassified Legionella TaxID=2622702 RepID=UPI0010555FEE|nr:MULTISPECIES: FAD-binding oxidoreductase [unclassified Legionella]MDI9817629.1 FAD-binding oxidoreductase [Legionella sp. PL877]
MLGIKRTFSNFSKAIETRSTCLRPDNENQLRSTFSFSKSKMRGLLARGNGSSYGDCCVNDQGVIIDTSRLNHFLSFDESTGVLVCQGGVTFAELFLVSPHHIPPVIPGTLRATVAGGIANDVHGKNNHREGSFGQHVQWIELQLGEQSLHCSPKENSELFYATIAGLGLTGIIKQVAISMRRASHFVSGHSEKHVNLESLLERMQTHGLQYDYQVAWLDLLNKPRALLSLANHVDAPTRAKSCYRFTVPNLPFRLVNGWNMRWFNRYKFHNSDNKEQVTSLQCFNNPLDSIRHWNRLYGKKGLLQFQALFNQTDALATIEQLLSLIHRARATPTLAVLKYFTQSGYGLLSFTQPGFTLAIDFVNNQQARDAISAMNELITNKGGKIYLAKDLLLTARQFTRQYPYHVQFTQLLTDYQSPLRSDLGRRLGLIHD